MGVVNCTPDSFSDGGSLPDVESAIAHGQRLLDQGADIVDVGGESTRPGAAEVPVTTELERVIPVVAGLRARRPEALISVDTTKAAVARAALQAGADIVNDVSAAADPEMLEVSSAGAAAIILMHRRGTPRTMQRDLVYADVVAEVHAFLRGRASLAVAKGFAPGQVWLDPGIGFGKDLDGNLALLAALPDLAATGHPVLVGPSRKSFIGHLTGAAVAERLPGTLAALLPSLHCPRAVVRVHDPAAAVQFLEVAARLRRGPG